MFKEYDTIVAKHDIENVPKGSSGVIVIVHETLKDFEVEFFNDEGETIDVLTVNEKDLELRYSYKS
jgi:hypothetical protein